MKARFKHSRNGASHGAAPAGKADAAPDGVAVLEAPQPVDEAVVAGDAAPISEAAPVAPVPLTSEAAPAGQAAPVSEVQPQGQTEPEGETPPEPVAPEPHHQLQEQLELLRTYEEMRTGLDNAEDAFRLIMPNYGLTTAFLVSGDSLHEVASGSIATRHAALVAAMEATAQQDAARHLARTTYSAFRRVGRTVIRTTPGRVALGLDEATPKANAAFAQVAEGALVVAQGEPYATLLTLGTFGPERVEETLTAVRLLSTSIAARRVAVDAAKRATVARDTAFAELRTYMNQLRVNVDTILRLNPHLARPVGF